MAIDINKHWKYARNEMKAFKQQQLEINKETQDRIQEVFNSLNISYNQLNSNIPKQLREKMKRDIKRYENNNKLKGYFKYKIDTLNKNNINYRTYIEIMLILAHLDELSSIDDISTLMFNDISLEYLNKGNKDLKKQPKKYLPMGLLRDLALVEVNGFIWKDYLEGLYLSNMQNTTKMCVDKIKADKELNINDDDFQRMIDKENNYLLAINGDKYSGGIDEYATTYANKSYLNASDGENAKVLFVSDKCDNVTQMCNYLDGMIFNTKDRNVFKRPYGDTMKALRMTQFDVNGLILGLNQPPITNHFHWCHSTLTYQIDRDIEDVRKEVYKKKNKKIYSDMIPSFLKYNGLTGEEAKEEAINLFPQKYRKELNKIKFNYNAKLCSYDYETKEIYLTPNANVFKVSHELAHYLEFNCGIKEDKKYIEIFNNKFSKYKKSDYVKSKDEWAYVLKEPDGFLNKYQTALYIAPDTFIGEIVNTDYILEYFSVGMEYYIKDKEYLKSVDKELYNYIKELYK